jgi:hypothetical protein
MCFCITVEHLLGFVVFLQEIILDSLKFQSMNGIPPTNMLYQLQSLQGKDNFLRCFFLNFKIHANRLLCLLYNDIPFQWDQHSQVSFESLK